MYAFCVKCRAVRLFYYRWAEAVYCCEVCGCEEKYPEPPLLGGFYIIRKTPPSGSSADRVKR